MQIDIIKPKKPLKSDICCNIHEYWGQYSEWNEPITKRDILYNSTYIKYLD